MLTRKIVSGFAKTPDSISARRSNIVSGFEKPRSYFGTAARKRLGRGSGAVKRTGLKRPF